MCGIVGAWFGRDSEAEELAAIGRTMGDTIQHRGPDDSGTFTASLQGLVIGHRRLSVLDLSPSGHQPMASASGRWVLAFNGEVYNHAELRQELGRRDWRGHSDTEVVVEGIERWGVEPLVQRLTGMFAMALWDKQEQRLWLIRDRAGEKPLYYGSVDRRLYFASELRAIAAALPGLPAVDRGALAGYLRHGYVPGPRSILEGISKLPPGAMISFDRVQALTGAGRLHQYWDAAARLPARRVQAERWTKGSYADAVEAELRRSIRAQMVADVPVGAFLSGGIDSSLVVALMQQESDRPVRTFTIGFDDPALNEAPFAHAVARHLNTEHTELYVSDAQARAIVPELATMYDEPFADSSQIPTALVSSMARKHVTVCLSGDGGDELFAGYSRYDNVLRQWGRVQSVPVAARRAIGSVLGGTPHWAWDACGTLAARLRGRMLARPLSETACRLRQRLLAPSLTAFYRHSVTHWSDVGALLGEMPEADTSAWPQLEGLERHLAPMDVLTLADTLTYLPDDVLVKVDRAAMSCSLELRAPMLDWHLIELAWESPAELRQGKRVLKELAYRHVPRDLLERPKRGFGVPLAAWLRGPLRDWADDLLSVPHLRTQGLVAPSEVARRWSEHRSGSADWSYSLWIVLMLTQWRSQSFGVRMTSDFRPTDRCPAVSVGIAKPAASGGLRPGDAPGAG